MEEKFILAFYKFQKSKNIEFVHDEILTFCEQNNILGTILLAHEGINGTISCDNENIADQFRFKISELFPEIGFKLSKYFKHPFRRLKVCIKKEIVAMGMDGIDEMDIDTNVGEYIDSNDWDDFIRRDDVILIDGRNGYESDIGMFKGSVRPDTISFREFPEWAKDNIKNYKDKKIAMYCTGGIRCEKTTALVRIMGHKDVYHLKGGVLQYFEDTKNKNGLWDGACFIFDERLSLDHNLEQCDAFCPKCRKVLTTDEVKFDFGHKQQDVCAGCTGA